MEVRVDTLGGLGDGVAAHEGRPVFIAKSCPGDRLEVRVTHENRNGMQGVITSILAPGPDRRDAPCPYYAHCGGCTLQHLSDESYRAFKTRMLYDALERGGFPRPEASVLFIPAASRRRVEFKIRHDGNAVALAFHEMRSHNTVPVDACLLLAPQLEALIAALNEALSQREFSPFLYAVSLTLADVGIDMLLTFKQYDIAALPPLDMLAEQLGLARISARVHEAKATIVTQRAPVEMTLGDYPVALPPEAFLQATRQGQDELTRIGLDAVQSAQRVVDLFCGIGSYSFPLSKSSQVHAVELEDDMVAALQAGIKRHRIVTLSAQRRDLFKQPLSGQELSGFQAAIINPPRLGAKAQTQALAQSSLSTIVMISCNPATFSRDAAILKAGGFALESASAIDQFLWSPHLEIAAVFRR